MKEEKIKKIVRKRYAEIAKQENSCCGPASTCGCGSLPATISNKIGYTDEELKAIPEGANMGLGCGNPVALASLREGETVLDLGSGGGLDCFLAAQQVGEKGKVIGIDMTPEMVEKARENARKDNYKNIEFRLGEIESLPVADSSVDVVISNCVINLVPDKRRAFRETFRVLKPGGRLMISDVVLLKALPDSVKNSVEAYVGCLSGALMRHEYLEAIEEAGFQEVRAIEETAFPIKCMVSDPMAKAILETLEIPLKEVRELAGSVRSIKVRGVKPE